MEKRVCGSRIGESLRAEAIVGRKREIQTYYCLFPPLDKFILQKLNTRKSHALSLLESASQEVLYRIIIELASTRIRYGYKRIYIMLKREGINVNKKRAHRLYCLEGRQLRPKRPRRKVSGALQIKFRAG